jgi:predicted Zn-dependent peptidase
VLTDGEASRLIRRLLLDDAIATSVSGYLGFMGDPFDVRDPTAILLQVHYPPHVTADQVVRAVDEELDRVATGGLQPGELARVQARLAAHVLREVDAVLGRTLSMAVLEQQRGRAELINELPALLATVTAEQVIAAAATLRPQRRAMLEVVPGGAK